MTSLRTSGEYCHQVWFLEKYWSFHDVLLAYSISPRPLSINAEVTELKFLQIENRSRLGRWYCHSQKSDKLHDLYNHLDETQDSPGLGWRSLCQAHWEWVGLWEFYHFLVDRFWQSQLLLPIFPVVNRSSVCQWLQTSLQDPVIWK